MIRSRPESQPPKIIFASDVSVKWGYHRSLTQNIYLKRIVASITMDRRMCTGANRSKRADSHSAGMHSVGGTVAGQTRTGLV